MTLRPNRSVRVVFPRRPHLPVQILTILLVLASTGRAEDSNTTIPWRTSYENAESEARATGRPLWVQFTGSWCVFCQRMEREVFALPEVVSLGRKAFLPVKVNADDRMDLLSRYGVTGLPATILVEPGGKVLARHEGFAEPQAFLVLLNRHHPASQTDSPNSEIALAGYDPVRLVEGNALEAGHPTLSTRHDGLVFRFAHEDDRDVFLEDPDRYLPVGHGLCPVNTLDRGRKVAGNPRFGVYYEGRLYLCADESARRRFAKNPVRYADFDLANDGHCPHCHLAVGQRVPGKRQFSTVYRGRRYLFPNAAHLQAFRNSPEIYVR